MPDNLCMNSDSYSKLKCNWLNWIKGLEIFMMILSSIRKFHIRAVIE